MDKRLFSRWLLQSAPRIWIVDLSVRPSSVIADLHLFHCLLHGEAGSYWERKSHFHLSDVFLNLPQIIAELTYTVRLPATLHKRQDPCYHCSYRGQDCDRSGTRLRSRTLNSCAAQCGCCSPNDNLCKIQDINGRRNQPVLPAVIDAGPLDLLVVATFGGFQRRSLSRVTWF